MGKQRKQKIPPSINKRIGHCDQLTKKQQKMFMVPFLEKWIATLTFAGLRGVEQPPPPSFLLWITFLRVKQNQQDITYSYRDKEQIGKSSKISNMSRKYGRERWKVEGTVEE